MEEAERGLEGAAAHGDYRPRRRRQEYVDGTPALPAGPRQPEADA